MIQQKLVRHTPAVCDELSELLPRYAVGAADHDEARHIESLLEMCPEA